MNVLRVACTSGEFRNSRQHKGERTFAARSCLTPVHATRTTYHALPKEDTMPIEEQIALVEEILTQWQAQLGRDYMGYRNHVYRMLNFCFALHDCTAEARQKLVIAGCFHDLGLWTSHTLDYLPPSIALAKNYLTQNRLDDWQSEIALMIAMHHKLSRYRDERYPLVELFRKGDLVDFSLGIVPCGLPAAYITRVKSCFPNAGFHQRLVQVTLGWVPRHPTKPLPIFKW